MKLLVRLPRWLGDVVMAEPTLRALHGRLGGDLTLAGAGAYLELLGEKPDCFRGDGGFGIGAGTRQGDQCVDDNTDLLLAVDGILFGR